MAYDCDILIAGASYAGLAAARHLAGAGARVLIIDEHAIGALRHSACALPTRTLAAIGALTSARQETRWGAVHTRDRSVRFPWPQPWTVVDHHALCLALRAHAHDLPFVQARITAFDGAAVTTTQGRVTARRFIDATGWRAVLASAVQPSYVDRRRLSFGLEVTVPGDTDALHFYVNKDIIPHGYGWVFPCAGERRIGLVAFDQTKGMADRLRAFLARLAINDDLRALPRNGGMLPAHARPVVVAGLWVLGDASGHCLPLTGEGIRFALHDGELAGQLLRCVLTGSRSWGVASTAYAAAVARHRVRVDRYARVQALVPAIPHAAYGPIFTGLSRRATRALVLRRYMARSDTAAYDPISAHAGRARVPGD